MGVTYIIDASLIAEVPYRWRSSFRNRKTEKLCYVAGVELLDGKLIVLTHLVHVKFTASRVHATPDPKSQLEMFLRMQRLGVGIHAQLHEHPGYGINSTRPSPVDLDTARVWESTAPFIGGIFDEGGRYVRFFNHSQESSIIVRGSLKDTGVPFVFEIPGLDRDEVPAKTSESSGLEARRPTEAACVDQARAVVAISGAEHRMRWPWR